MQILRLAIGGSLAMVLLLALSLEHGPAQTNAATINVACNTTALTDAINTANNETTNPGADTLELSPACNYAYATPATAVTALPIISTTITINGHGATISRDPGAATRFRIISVSGSNGYLILKETTIRGGRAPNGSGAGQPGQAGGGVALTSGALEIIDSTLTDNQAGNGSDNGLMGGNGGLGGSGGGILATSGFLTIHDSTIYANSAGNGGAGRPGSPGGGIGGGGGSGGGISAGTATVTISNSTISGNTAGSGGTGGAGSGAGGNGGGAAFTGSGTRTLTNVTVAFNNAGTGGSGGGLYKGAAGTVGKNTIFADNTTGGDCSGLAFAAGTTNNITSDGSCGLASSPSINLASLSNNGGPTLTHALGGGSSAIDAGNDTVCASAPVNNLDQRGVSRPVDGDTTAGSVCDIGAYEAPALQLGPQFIVDTTAADDDGACHLPPGDCTLREAINAANSDGQGSEIRLGNALTYTLTGVDNAGNGLPLISTDIVIMGNGSTIRRDPAAPLFRLFQVQPGGVLLLDTVTVSGGEATGATGDGGGIYVNGGQLNTFFSKITGNRAAAGATGNSGGAGMYGGGIAISSGGNAFIAMSTVTGNVAGQGGGGFTGNGGNGGGGGGIAVFGGTLTVDRSLVSVNFAGAGGFGSSGSGGSGGHGGGLYLAGGSNATITNSTIFTNSAGGGGGGSTGNGNGGSGGGINSPSSITTLTNVTFNANNVGAAGGAGAVSGSGAGIYDNNNATTVRNTIMANGTGANCAFLPYVGSGNNISTDTSCGATFTQRTPAQINFGTFGNYGGPTFTLPLLPGSAAIDTGSQSICDSQFIGQDQRGVIRPYDGDGTGGSICDVGAFEYCPDADLDLRCAGFDNCPYWANPSQNTPDWFIPAGDSDCDNFTDEAEVFSGTDPAGHCASTSTRNDEAGTDRWPSDFDDNQIVNIIDVSTFSSHYGSIGPNPPYDPRWDFNGDNRVNIIDVSKMSQTYGKNCSG